MPCISWKVGKGGRISFWSDQWIEGGLLKNQFPQIYNIDQNKVAKICEYYVDVGGGRRVWQVLISRNLKDWELNEYERPIAVISI